MGHYLTICQLLSFCNSFYMAQTYYFGTVRTVCLRIVGSFVSLNVSFKILKLTQNCDISQALFSTVFTWLTIFSVHLNCTETCPCSTIDNTSALLQVLVWRQAGGRPLPDLMLTQFSDAYICHFVTFQPDVRQMFTYPSSLYLFIDAMC